MGFMGWVTWVLVASIVVLMVVDAATSVSDATLKSAFLWIGLAANAIGWGGFAVIEFFRVRE